MLHLQEGLVLDHKQRIRSCALCLRAVLARCAWMQNLTTIANSTRVRHASKNTKGLETISNSASAKNNQDLRASSTRRIF